MDWEPEIKDSEFVPRKRKPTEETVCYKIGGTYYEVSTSCGGSEQLRDKILPYHRKPCILLALQ